MKLIKLECPNCHAKCDVKEGESKFTCEYCGTTTMIEDDSLGKTLETTFNSMSNMVFNNSEMKKNRNTVSVSFIIISVISVVIFILAFIFMFKMFISW